MKDPGIVKPVSLPCIELSCEECAEASLERHAAAFEAVGFERAAGMAMSIAQELFTLDQDDEAQRFRDFSRALTDRGKELREDQNKAGLKKVACKGRDAE